MEETIYSELACEPVSHLMRLEVLEDPEVRIYREQFEISDPFLGAKRYNIDHLNWIPVSCLPRVRSVLVIGAGGSFTRELLASLELDDYDAVILTIPMLEYFDHLLDWPGVYVVDAELELFVTEHYFPEGVRERVKLISPSVKCFNPGFKAKALYFYERDAKMMEDDHSDWPRSGGAAGLHVATRVMGATHVDCVGIDLTGHHDKFSIETRRYLELPEVHQIQDPKTRCNDNKKIIKEEN